MNLTKEEISARFDTPSQVAYDQLRNQNRALKIQLDKNQSKMNSMIPAIEKEAEAAANKLDKDFPDWRKVLVADLKNR